jgi:4-hydroxybenzoate polyprenyltransferase
MTDLAHTSSKPGFLNMARALLKTMRPRQWTKNGFVYAALLFDGKLFEPALFLRTTVAFACFCLISSATYLINDLVDVEKDRQHPTKRNRPLAAGILPPWVAVAAAIVFVVVCLPVAFWLSPAFGAILVGYLLLTLAYTFYLKQVVIVDLLVLAGGFVLRVAGGVAVIDVERYSPW